MPSSPNDLLEVGILDDRRVTVEPLSAPPAAVHEGRHRVWRLRGGGRDPRVDGRGELGDRGEARGRDHVHGHRHRRSPAPSPARTTGSQFGGWVGAEAIHIQHSHLMHHLLDCLCTQHPSPKLHLPLSSNILLPLVPRQSLESGIPPGSGHCDFSDGKDRTNYPGKRRGGAGSAFYLCSFRRIRESERARPHNCELTQLFSIDLFVTAYLYSASAPPVVVSDAIKSRPEKGLSSLPSSPKYFQQQLVRVYVCARQRRSSVWNTDREVWKRARGPRTNEREAKRNSTLWEIVRRGGTVTFMQVRVGRAERNKGNAAQFAVQR